MKNILSIAKTIWFAVCFIGNVFQIVKISDQFFKYEIVTTISVSFPDIFVAPAISVCFFEIELVDWDKLILIKPNVKQQLNMSSLSNEEITQKINTMSFFGKRKFQGIMFDGLNIEERSKIIKPFDSLFNECSLTDTHDVLMTT